MANGYCQSIYGYEEVNNRIAKMKEEEEEEEAKNSEPTTKQNNSWYCQTIPGIVKQYPDKKNTSSTNHLEI
jgi:hypothetical protein